QTEPVCRASRLIVLLADAVARSPLKSRREENAAALADQGQQGDGRGRVRPDCQTDMPPEILSSDNRFSIRSLAAFRVFLFERRAVPAQSIKWHRRGSPSGCSPRIHAERAGHGGRNDSIAPVYPAQRVIDV